MTSSAVTVQQASPVLFRPDGAWVGDVIPVAYDGRFWLFYLHEIRDDDLSGTGWGLVTTRNFVEFEDHGVVFPAGGVDAEDFNAYTGSVVLIGSTAFLFYTGQSPWRLADDGETAVQLVMQATSTDGMRTWQRHPERTFGPPEHYEPGDWRDPFVFRPDPAGPWRMILAARHTEGPQRRRGLIAQMVSDDLVTWRPAEPFWDPRRYIAHECPEVFRWGDWWYLVFSEFSESFTTRYRMARDVNGPWLVPNFDTVDGRAFYAAKTVAQNGRRFFVGWISTKAAERDDGEWEWAGTMSALEARQRADGTLAFALPTELTATFDEPLPGVAPPSSEASRLRLAVPDGYAAVVGEEEAPARFLLSTTIDIAPGTREVGVLLHSDADGDRAYMLRLEPQRARMVFDRWPRRRTGPGQWQISGDQPHAIELERPCRLQPGRHLLEVLVDGTALVAVLDHDVALSARIYDRALGRVGLFAGEGEATFTDVTVRQRSNPTTDKEAQ